jgi:hypothetical protein
MDTDFLTLVCNYGTVRRTEVDGRSFYVAPVTLIVPGVLIGNQGPLLYPKDEVERSAPLWDNVEITYGHPKSNLDRRVLGVVRNSRIRNRKLVAEAWIDADTASKVDPRITEALRSGKQIEVSTGLAVTNEPVLGEWNGRVYTGVVRNFSPDHLAVLLDAVGACSIRDGCGLNVTNCKCQEKNMSKKVAKLDDTQREELVSKIVENSDGLYAETDAEVLNKLTDNQLLKIRQGQIDHGKLVTENAQMQDANKKLKDEVEKAKKVENEDHSDDGKGTVENKKGGTVPDGTPKIDIQNEIKKYMGSLSADQYYELAPPEVKEVIKQSHKVFNERKTELIEQLVANCADDDLKKTMTENFAAKSIDELELLSQAFGKPAVSDNPFRANYSGRSVGVSNTAAEMSKKDREDFLPVPVMNFSTEEDAA